MAKGKKGIFSRLVEGPERSEDYARKTLPTNRWALGWDLFKNNLGKIVKINLLVLLFIFPIFVVLYFRSVLLSGQAMLAPFSQNIAIGYPAFPFLTGEGERILLNTNAISFAVIIILALYCSVGISGGLYVMRNLVWTEGVFVSSDFWTGVKKNYGIVLASTLTYLILLSITILSINLSNLQIALSPSSVVIFTITKILSYIFIFFFTSVYLFMLTLSVTYELKFIKLIKNAIILTVGLLPINVFFMAFSCIMLTLLLFDITSMMFSLGLILVLLIGLGVFLLIWTNYSQWVFDEFLNDKVAGAKKYRGIYKKTDGDDEEFVYRKSTLTSRPIKPITDYDIEIAELPQSYSRADLIRLEESKKRMIEDSDRYAEEHSGNLDKIDEFMQNDGDEEVSTEKDKK